MKKIMVRWRHIPIELALTPFIYISVDHTLVEVDDDSDWAIAEEIGRMFKWISPDHVRIESKHIIKLNP